ncbi:MAG: tetratricopeptide repeat protein [Chloroflexi bacterium]|nr:tetratricopeptide repeat protein [Chloroflexota bacterium]
MDVLVNYFPLGLVFWGSICLAIALKRNKSPWWFFAGIFQWFGVLMILCASTKEDEYRELGKHHKAMFGEEKTVKHDANSPELFNDRGVDCGDQGRYSMAITNFTKAIEIDSKYAISYFNRARAFEQLGKTEDAISGYETFISLSNDPNLIGKAKTALGQNPDNEFYQHQTDDDNQFISADRKVHQEYHSINTDTSIS